MANFNTHSIENKFVLYHHINPLTNEVFYVGIGDARRPFEHSSRSKWWNSTVAKYGLIVEVISTDLTWKDACEWEILFIKYFGRRDKGKGKLVNMTDGGDGSAGCYPSEETRKKMSSSQKNVDRSLMPQHRKGRELSEEHKKKIGDSGKKKGRTCSEKTKKKMSLKRELYWKNKAQLK
jgi:hypothetical protein